ncbi:MAG: hypothetical protein V4584_00725 [Verrucomicrobiota bacterium]
MNVSHTAMTARHSLLFLLAAASVSSASAEMRAWKNTDGTRSVQGEYIKRDATSVTIKTDTGKELTIELAKLHADERKWLEAKQSQNAPAQEADAFFDNLTFRDTRETTEAKLKASKLVVLTTDETFIGRSGLNGAFRTRQKIGTMDGYLYFDWTETGKLKELNLQTETRPDTAYKTELEPAWKQLIELLGTLYGKPVQKGPLPAMASLADGTFAPSHLWTIESGGCAMLGTAREGTKYQVVVRFSQKKPQVVEIP